jgi:hypothetical protein
LAPPRGQNLYPKGNEIHNFGRGFPALHHHAFSFSYIHVVSEKKMFLKLINIDTLCPAPKAPGGRKPEIHNLCPKDMVADLCQSTICRHFVMSWRKDDKTRRQNDKYRLFAPKRRQIDKTTKRKVDKTTKLGRKDDKNNPLISDLICRLFAWGFVVLSSFRLEKTTE